MASGTQKLGAVSVLRMVAATAVTLALGVASPIVLVHGLLGDSELLAWAAFLVAMVLVAAATAVATLWSGPNLVWGSVVGLLLAAPPVSIVSWIEVIKEGDPLGPVVSSFVTVVALAVSSASWVVALGVDQGRKQGWFRRAAASPLR